MATPSLWKLSALLLLLGAGCESPPEVKRDGFLTQYYLLENLDGTPRQLWVNPNADFALYHGAVFDPVTVWGNDQDTLADSAMEQVRKLCQLLRDSVRDALAGRDVEIASRQARGVLRVRLAITEAASAPDLVATILRKEDDAALELLDATREQVGPARIEFELSDSVTNELLCAAAQRLDGSEGGVRGTIEEVMAACAEILGDVVRGGRRE